jgi:hypothetical protein
MGTNAAQATRTDIQQIVLHKTYSLHTSHASDREMCLSQDKATFRCACIATPALTSSVVGFPKSQVIGP